MAHFAPPMISMTYEQVAKPFVSLGEINPFAFAVFRLVQAQNERAAKSTAASGLARRTLRNSATRKWRPKPSKSLKTNSEMASRFSVAGKENRSGEFRVSP